MLDYKIQENIESLTKSPILTQKEKEGYLFELAVDRSLHELSLDYKSNPFGPYEWKKSQKKGTDHEVKYRKQKAILEDKNLNGKYFLNPSLFRSEILHRFYKEDPEHKALWVLVISIAKLGRKVLALIREYRIKIVQIGFKVTLESIGKAIQIITKKLALLFKVRGVFSLSKLCRCRNNIFEKISYGKKEQNEFCFLPDGGCPAEIKELSLDDIIPDFNQPRKHFDETKLIELAESIKRHGLLQPILVRPLEGDKFELVHGERRWRACRIAGKRTILAEVRNVSNKEKIEIQLVENLQRQDLNPMEEAETFRRLVDEFGYTHEEIGKRIAKSREYVTNKLRLLNLPSKIREDVRKGSISEGHARALLSLEPNKQEKISKEVIDKGLNVREIEEFVRTLKKESDVSRETSNLVGDLINHISIGKERIPLLISLESEVYSALEQASKANKMEKERIVSDVVSEFLQKNGYLSSVKPLKDSEEDS